MRARTATQNTIDTAAAENGWTASPLDTGWTAPGTLEGTHYAHRDGGRLLVRWTSRGAVASVTGDLELGGRDADKLASVTGWMRTFDALATGAYSEAISPSEAAMVDTIEAARIEADMAMLEARFLASPRGGFDAYVAGMAYARARAVQAGAVELVASIDAWSNELDDECPDLAPVLPAPVVDVEWSYSADADGVYQYATRADGAYVMVRMVGHSAFGWSVAPGGFGTGATLFALDCLSLVDAKRAALTAGVTAATPVDPFTASPVGYPVPGVDVPVDGRPVVDPFTAADGWAGNDYPLPTPRVSLVKRPAVSWAPGAVQAWARADAPRVSLVKA